MKCLFVRCMQIVKLKCENDIDCSGLLLMWRKDIPSRFGLTVAGVKPVQGYTKVMFDTVGLFFLNHLY